MINRRQLIIQSLGAGSLVAGCASGGGGRSAPKVVVVGGGYGGATTAKYVRMWSDYGIDVTLVEPNSAFISCPISNLVLGGSKTLADIRTPYDRLVRQHVKIRVSYDSDINLARQLCVESARETERVLENVKSILADQKLTFANVVKSTVFMTNLGDFAAYIRAETAKWARDRKSVV